MASLEITTVHFCKNNCSFCPQSTLAKAYSGQRAMDMDTFKKCLGSVPLSVRIDFSGFVEPLFNGNAAEMMWYARAINFDVHLYTTLMGLEPPMLIPINQARPSHIRIHVPDSVGGLVIPDDKWIEQHELWLCVGLKGSYMAMGQPTPVVAEYLRRLGIEVELPQMLSRGGNVEKVKPIHRIGGIRCTMDRWYSNVLMPDGSVYGCCMDYGLTVPLGNLLFDSYEEIRVEAEAWRKNMEHDATGTICSKCEWATPK